MIVGTAPNHDVRPCLVLLKRDRKPFPYPPASQPTPPLLVRDPTTTTLPHLPSLHPHNPPPADFLGQGLIEIID